MSYETGDFPNDRDRQPDPMLITYLEGKPTPRQPLWAVLGQTALLSAMTGIGWLVVFCLMWATAALIGVEWIDAESKDIPWQFQLFFGFCLTAAWFGVAAAVAWIVHEAKQ